MVTGVGIRNRVPGIPQSRSWKSGTGTGTHFKVRDCDQDYNSNFAGSETRPGLIFEKSGTRERDASIIREQQFFHPGPTGNFPGQGPGPVRTPAFVSHVKRKNKRDRIRKTSPGLCHREII